MLRLTGKAERTEAIEVLNEDSIWRQMNAYISEDRFGHMEVKYERGEYVCSAWLHTELGTISPKFSHTDRLTSMLGLIQRIERLLRA